MADLSKIKLNGTEYDLKDSYAREAIANIPEDKIFPVNVTLTSITEGTSDKTHNEIATAVNAGKIPFVYINYSGIKMIAPLARVESNYSVFTYEDQTVPDHLNYARLIIQNSTASIIWRDKYTTLEDLSDYLQTNDYITSNNTYTKTEIDGLVSGVFHYKGTKATVSELPSNDNDIGDVWYVTADDSEWAWNGSNWQELGTAVDLSNYLQTSDIADWAKAENKPTYTAAEVGALPSTYTAPVTSVNGQTGEVNLTIPAAQVQSDWNATSGMGVILNKPTIPAATTVTNTLASGTLIATINGTNIYAPAYTDADGVSY